MAQNKIKFNDIEIFQPDKGLGYNFETTYTEDSGRPLGGKAHVTSLFTVESYSYSASNIPVEEMTKILQIIAKGKPFKMHYFSCYYGKWRNDVFYIGKGSLKIGSLKADEEYYESLSFNIVGVNPI